MTIGISKERLIEIKQSLPYGQARLNIDRLIKAECTELDPWLPIANAPKDKPIWLFNGFKVLAQWSGTLGCWHVMLVYHEGNVAGFDRNAPYTHYKLLQD